MLYSSGTTGQARRACGAPLPRVPAGHPSVLAGVVGLAALFGISENDRYLTPAPLYHAAPIGFTSAMQRIGATAVVMRRFDAEDALRIDPGPEGHRVAVGADALPPPAPRSPRTCAAKYDLSSLRVAIHAAAPCPIPLKEAMIEWWGDAIVEYYGGTEGGGTLIRAQEWLAHKGSVGRHWAGGMVHILDEDGGEIDAAAHARARSTSRRRADAGRALLVPQGRRRRPRRPTAATSSRSATSATRTRTATCT